MTTPQADGFYFYADYCSGRIWAAAEQADGVWIATEVLDTEHNVSSFGEDEAGELYIAHHAPSDGTIYRMVLHDAIGSLRPSPPIKPPQRKGIALPWLPLLLD